MPDTQIRPGVPLDHIDWIASYIVEKRPDVVVIIGDWADMSSLSSYDKGKKSFEGRTYRADILAANDALQRLMAPIRADIERRQAHHKVRWSPRLIFCEGNHEYRIPRAIEVQRELDGLISSNDLFFKQWGFEVYPFLEPVVVDGVAYCHYFVSGVMGRPISTARAILQKKYMSCVAGHQQGYDVATAYRGDGQRITAIIAGSCLHPDHKVLTADLRYVPLRGISVGDKLVSFDEGPIDEPVGQRKGPRRYKTGTVLSVRLMRGEMFAVTLSGGKTFRATADHLWLTKNSGSLYSWKRTDQLRKTRPDAIGGKGGGTRIVRLLDEWTHDKSWESGWLAGMYCGEGSLYHRKTTGGSCMQLTLSQSETHNPETCRRIESSLRTVCGVDVDKNASSTRSTNAYRIVGGSRGIAKVLGTVRPPRMLDKFVPEMLGSIGGMAEARAEFIVSIEPVGIDEYMQIEIDAKTMVVEGYAHHNCYLHDEDYLNPQSNKHYRGVVVLNEVNNGEFDEMKVSLAFLREKYGKKARSPEGPAGEAGVDSSLSPPVSLGPGGA